MPISSAQVAAKMIGLTEKIIDAFEDDIRYVL